MQYKMSCVLVCATTDPHFWSLYHYSSATDFDTMLTISDACTDNFNCVVCYGYTVKGVDNIASWFCYS